MSTFNKNLAEWVGFEPTVPLPVHLISSQGRYNHFDTTPYLFQSVFLFASGRMVLNRACKKPGKRRENAERTTENIKL